MSPHPGMHVLCPACEGPIPDLLGELTDDYAGVNNGTRAIDYYYCGAPLIYSGLGSLVLGSAASSTVRRTAQRRDIRFGDSGGVEAWISAVEKALEDEANSPYRDPTFAPIVSTKMVNKYGRRAFEGYPWT